MVTIQDVAKEAGVSPATVSRVINNSLVVSNSKRKLVMDAIETLGYEIPARITSNGKLVLVISDVSDADFNNQLYAALSNFGYQMFMFYYGEGQNTQDDLLRFLQTYTQQVAGLILCNFDRSIDPLLMETLNKFLIVQMDSELPFHQTVSIGINRFQASYEATKHLAHLGCRRIATFRGTVYPQSSTGTRETDRINGYRSALLDCGLSIDPDLLIDCGYTAEDCYEATLAQLRQKKQPPDAFICPVDSTALGAMRAIQELQLVIPQQIRVMSLMDEWYSPYVTPSLSTLNFPREAVSRAAAQQLHDMISGRQTVQQKILLPYTFSYRESTEG